MSSPVKQNKPAKQATAAVDKNILSPASRAYQCWVLVPGVPLAALASPRAKLCRLLRRLVDFMLLGLNPG